MIYPSGGEQQLRCAMVRGNSRISHLLMYPRTYPRAIHERVVYQRAGEPTADGNGCRKYRNRMSYQLLPETRLRPRGMGARSTQVLFSASRTKVSSSMAMRMPPLYWLQRSRAISNARRACSWVAILTIVR